VIAARISLQSSEYTPSSQAEAPDLRRTARCNPATQNWYQDPAATDATRVLRLPDFANKKYETDFYVEARRKSTEIYHLRDFKLHIDSHDSPHHNFDTRAKRDSSPRTNLSQSEHDWAFAKRALARGDNPEDVIQQIAHHRARDKSDPQDYGRRTVTKAAAELKSEADRQTHSSLTTNENNRELGH
jgi:hypothetical protein